MTVAIGIALALTAVSVVCLFAMFGELSARVEAIGAGRTASQEDWIRPLEGFDELTWPERWPSELSQFGTIQSGILIILGTSCTSCARFVERGLEPLSNILLPMAVVISCPSQPAAERFLRDQPELAEAGYPIFVDVGGEWTREELGLDISPSAAAFQDGRALSVVTMSSASELAVHVASLYATAPVETDRDSSVTASEGALS